MSKNIDPAEQENERLLSQSDTTVDQAATPSGFKISGAYPRKDLTGTTLARNYEILALIGSGGMSVVYKARHKLMKSLAAIKMLHAHLLSHQKTLQRFQQEAQAVKTLSHPNIVYVSDFGVTDDGQPYLVMDYLEGISLSELIRRQGKVEVERALHILTQTCDALSHAHGKGIIHRDLKPSNIMLVRQEADNDFVKIVDFGIAKLGEETQQGQHLTQTGEVFGSPPYMSPEQCLGSKLDARSDVYSFGCVMYEALTGLAPFKGESSLATMHKHLNDTPQPLSLAGLDPRLAARLDAIVFKCLEKEPDKRYQTMQDVRAQLLQLQEGGKIGRGNPTAMLFLRLSRFKRALRQSMRQHPVRTLAVPLVLILIIAACFSLCLPLQALLGPPPGSSRVFSFSYAEPPKEKPPADFDARCDKISFLLGQMNNRLPADDPDLIERRRQTASFFMKFGFWGRAAEQLQLIYVATRGKGDSDGLPVTNNVIVPLSEAYALDSQLERAEAFLHVALSNYHHLYGDDGHSGILLAHLGAILERENKESEALAAYTEASQQLGDPRAVPECAQTASALGDLYMSRAASAEEPGSARAYYLQARRQFEQALAFWQDLPGSSFNYALCLNRLAECTECLNEWSSSEKYYALATEKLQQELGSKSPYLRVIKSNYARMLFKQKRFLQAFFAQIDALSVREK